MSEKVNSLYLLYFRSKISGNFHRHANMKKFRVFSVDAKHHPVLFESLRAYHFVDGKMSAGMRDASKEFDTEIEAEEWLEKDLLVSSYSYVIMPVYNV